MRKYVLYETPISPSYGTYLHQANPDPQPRCNKRRIRDESVDWDRTPWRKCTLVKDKPINWFEAKPHEFSDSMLCVDGKCQPYPRSAEAWERRVEWFADSPQFRELDNVSGEPVVCVWKIFPRHTSLELVDEVRKMMDERRIEPQKIEDCIIFMSMNSDTMITFEKRTEQFNGESCYPSFSRRLPRCQKLENASMA